MLPMFLVCVEAAVLLAASAWVPATPAAGPASALLLQHRGRATNAARNLAWGDRTRSALATPFPPDFFGGDAQKMAEMPPYNGPSEGQAGLHGGERHGRRKEPCHPNCAWKCGPKSECDEVCEPVCLPPKCKTLCRTSVGLCQTRCSQPQCAVVCPETNCLNSACPKCKTVCAPPVCTTQCGDDCESVCEKPECSWKCHPVTCPQPICSLACHGFPQCALAMRNASQTPTAPPEQDIVGEAMASLDPTVLMHPAAAPPPWPMQGPRLPNGLNPFRWQRAAPVQPRSEVGAVRGLKLKWAAEDKRLQEKSL